MQATADNYEQSRIHQPLDSDNPEALECYGSNAPGVSGVVSRCFMDIQGSVKFALSTLPKYGDNKGTISPT